MTTTASSTATQLAHAGSATETGGTVASADGTILAWTSWGRPGAPAIVLVDGATQHRALDMTGGLLGRLLARRFHVVAFDRRGRGGSGDSAPYAVEREIEDIAAVARLAPGPVTLLGQSSGAVLAARAAALLPVAALICWEPPFVVTPDRPSVPADYVTRLDAAVADGRPGDAVLLLMTEAAGMPIDFARGMTGAPFWPAMQAVGHTVAYDGRIMGDCMQGDRAALSPFAAIDVPTLVLAGGASPAWMQAAAAALVEVVPAAQLQTLVGQQHQVDPAALAAAADDYLSALLQDRS